ncbi:MAG: hypothetical protein GY862_01615 [Gammaproteobacteria bacterium]|nr:hypothetical protein [Gammaproteobacteria bacterium]
MSEEYDDKDTRDWLAALSGKAVTDADPATVREAEALRDELLFRNEAAEVDPRIAERIFARLEAERKPFWHAVGKKLPGGSTASAAADLPEAAGKPATKKTLFCRQYWQAGLSLAASVAAIGILFLIVWPPMPPEQEEFTEKNMPTVRELSVSDPQTTGKQLQRELQKLELKVDLEQHPDGWLLIIPELPAERYEAAAVIFSQYDGMHISRRNKQLRVLLVKAGDG